MKNVLIFTPPARNCGLQWQSLMLFLLLGVGEAVATPIHYMVKRQSTNSSSGDGSTGAVSPKIWIPVVVVVLTLLGIFCFVWTRTSVLSRIRGVANTSTSSTPPQSGAREVTAAELMGVTATNASNTNGNGSAGRNGRSRRNRRRQSQMSTHSLPVYMKEPGDHELVIFTGPEPMDASEMIAEAREAEDGEDSEAGHGRSLSLQRIGAADVTGTGAEDREVSGRDLLTEPRNLNTTSVNPDQSAQSLGLASTNGAESDAPDTSTTQLLAHISNNNTTTSTTPSVPHTPTEPSATDPNPERGHERSDSANTTPSISVGRQGLLRRVSEVPSEAPPGYETEAISPGGVVSGSTSDHRQSSSMGSISPGSMDMDPPGLLPAERHVQIGVPEGTGRRPRSRTQGSSALQQQTRIGRFSRFLHFRSTSDLVSAEGDPSGSSDGTQGRALNNMTSVISLNEPPLTLPDTGNTDSNRHPPISHGHSRHRSSQSGGSGSTSTLSLALPFRQLHRARSTNTLSHQRSSASLASQAQAQNASRSQTQLHHIAGSPSTTSLTLSLANGASPISAPLPHTLVRTEIRYPPRGPTPEQLRLLSSRDSGFGRFGIPYGEEAERWAAAASRSRLDLSGEHSTGQGEASGTSNSEPPPPEFESPTTEIGRSAARAAEEARLAAASPNSTANASGNGRMSTSSEGGEDPDAIPSGLLRTIEDEEREREEREAAALDPRVFVPMFM